MLKHELTAIITKMDSARQIAWGPVLIPDERDSDDDSVNAQKIEQVCIDYMLKYQNVDLMHSLNNVGKIVYNEILRADETFTVDGLPMTAPKGSWCMGVHIEDPVIWKMVETGELGGFSIMAIPQTVHKSVILKTAEKKDVLESMKRTTLADLEAGGDWVVNCVSLVDKPAVPKAKLVILKQYTEKCGMVAPVGSFDWIRGEVYKALESKFGLDLGIDYLFSDAVIFRVWGSRDGSELDPSVKNKKFRINYLYSGQKISIVGEAQEVEVEAVIVPKRSAAEWESLIELSKKATAGEEKYLSGLEIEIVQAKARPEMVFEITNPESIKGHPLSHLTPAEVEGVAARYYRTIKGELPREKESIIARAFNFLTGSGAGTLAGDVTAKGGMTFSSVNMDKLTQMQTSLASFSEIIAGMIKEGEEERQRKDKSKLLGGKSEMETKEFNEHLVKSLAEPDVQKALGGIVADAIKAAGVVKTETPPPADDDPADDKNKDGNPADEGDGGGQGDGGEDELNTEAVKALEGKIEELKTALTGLKSNVIKRKTPAVSKALPGQDPIPSNEGGKPEDYDQGVNPMGYKAHHRQGRRLESQAYKQEQAKNGAQ